MSEPTRVTPDFQLVEDIVISLRAELDKRSTSFHELLTLDVGSILELNRSTGDNVDLYAGDTLVAGGEIMVIDSTLAVRVADFGDKLKDERRKQN